MTMRGGWCTVLSTILQFWILLAKRRSKRSGHLIPYVCSIINKIVLSNLSGRRMIAGTGHRKVYWWGERTKLSIIDL